MSVVQHEFDSFLNQNRQMFADVYSGITYVPPSDSRFRTADELEQFEIDITDKCISHKYVYIVGDFNACAGCNEE